MNIFGAIFYILLLMFFGVLIYYLYIEFRNIKTTKPLPLVNPKINPINPLPLPISICDNVNKYPCSTNGECHGFPAPDVELKQTVIDFIGTGWGLSKEGYVYFIPNGGSTWTKVGNDVFNSIATLNTSEMVWTTGSSMVWRLANPSNPLPSAVWNPLNFSLDEICVSSQDNFIGTFCGNTYTTSSPSIPVPKWTQVNSIVCNKSSDCGEFPSPPDDFVKVITDANGSGWALTQKQEIYFVTKTGENWNIVSGSLIDIATSDKGNSVQVWGINNIGNIYSSNNPLKPTSWISVSGNLDNICVNKSNNFTGSAKGIIYTSTTNDPTNPGWVSSQ